MSRVGLRLLFPVILLGVLLAAGWEARQWFFSARLFPLVLVTTGVFLLLLHLGGELLGSVAPSKDDEAGDYTDVGIRTTEGASVFWRGLEIWAWIVGLLIAILTIGMPISLPLFAFVYLKVQAKEGWWVSLLIPLFVAGFMYALFERVLHMPWIEGALWTWLAR